MMYIKTSVYDSYTNSYSLLKSVSPPFRIIRIGVIRFEECRRSWRNAELFFSASFESKRYTFKFKPIGNFNI